MFVFLIYQVRTTNAGPDPIQIPDSPFVLPCSLHVSMSCGQPAVTQLLYEKPYVQPDHGFPYPQYIEGSS